MMRAVVAVTSLACAAAFTRQTFPAHAANLTRTYTAYESLPMTASDADAQGWTRAGDCEAYLGVPYVYGGSSPSKDAPLTLFFAAGSGAFSGARVSVYGGSSSVVDEWVDAGYYTLAADGTYVMDVATRDPSAVCGGGAEAGEGLGDRLVMNPAGVPLELPVLREEAEAEAWLYEGSCFAAMGTHFFGDFSGGDTLSWKKANLLPLSIMYWDGVLHAMFFTTVGWQGSQSRHTWWEPAPLDPYFFCKNLCDDDCTYDTLLFTTMHIFFGDTNFTCAGGCQIGCCDAAN